MSSLQQNEKELHIKAKCPSNARRLVLKRHTFLRIIVARRTNGTFGFDQHTSRTFAKRKEPFFVNAPLMN